MNVTVLGATGAIGSLTVDHLLADGHTVTAYVRNPQKVPAHWGDRVRVVVGEMADAAAIDSAIAGADAVVSALGPSMDRKATGLPLVEGTRHVLEAMARHGVRRYVGHGTPSVADPQEQATFQSRFVGFMGRNMLPRAYKELLGVTALVTAADVDWTIVRFIRPTNGEPTGTVKAGFFGTDKIGFAITRGDIAAFTADQVTDARYVGRAPAVSN